MTHRFTVRLRPEARTSIERFEQALQAHRSPDVLAEECARSLDKDFRFLEPFMRDGHCAGTAPVELVIDLDTEWALEELADRMGMRSWKYVYLLWLARRTERYR